MNSLPAFLAMNRPCDQALDWLADSLAAEGLRILRTFDLHLNAHIDLDCPCPHHGTEQCDCQMVVVLVYGKALQPATLVLHSSDGQTWLSLVDNPRQRADPGLYARIEHALKVDPLE